MKSSANWYRRRSASRLSVKTWEEGFHWKLTVKIVSQITFQRSGIAWWRAHNAPPNIVDVTSINFLISIGFMEIKSLMRISVQSAVWVRMPSNLFEVIPKLSLLTKGCNHWISTWDFRALTQILGPKVTVHFWKVKVDLSEDVWRNLGESFLEMASFLRQTFTANLRQDNPMNFQLKNLIKIIGCLSAGRSVGSLEGSSFASSLIVA